MHIIRLLMYTHVGNMPFIKARNQKSFVVYSNGFRTLICKEPSPINKKIINILAEKWVKYMSEICKSSNTNRK